MDLCKKRMERALKAMGNPCAETPAIQIVGTNGKGSIASFIQSCLKIARIKAGVTTSPHLLCWCERIRIDGDQISPEEFRQHLLSLRELAEAHYLTPFELLIATAFKHFSQNEVELLVLEVGLGGRLDATTAHPFRPVIATAGIGLDHCEHLGKTLKEIATEKAAVITPGSTVISAEQDPVVTKVLEKTVQDRKARIHWVPPLTHDWNLGLNGEIQRKNAAVAIGALQALKPLGWDIHEQRLREGLVLAKWPGRLQTTNWKGFPVLIDGAHNPHAARQLSRERTLWKQNELGVQWIIGIQSNKDAPTMLRFLLQPSDVAWIVPVPNHKSWTKFELAKASPQIAKQLLPSNDVQMVFKVLRMEEKWPSPPPVVAGSLYLISDLLKQKIVKA